MARPLRIEYPDAIYHVTARGIERRDIVADDRDRNKWLALLQRTVEAYRWHPFSFALMNTHYHLFVQTPDANLSTGMHYFNGSYAGYFNARHSRSGHLFGGRYKTVLVEGEGHWLELSRYIHLNPVRAGIVRKPEDWKWSTFKGYCHLSHRLAWIDYGQVLAEFGGDASSGRKAYKTFVEAGLASRPKSPLSEAVQGMILGSKAFVEKIRGLLGERPHDRELPALSRLRRRPALEEVIAKAAGQFGSDSSHWKYGRRCDDPARAVAAYVARRTTGLRGAEIAEALGYRNVSSVSVACRRIEREMRHPSVAKKVQRLLEEVSANH
jgi:REP element-mobilizing transposase RayT